MCDEAVRVFRGIESALRRRHIAAHIIEHIPRDAFEKRIARDLKSIEIRDRQLRLIVEHFFEMRHVPKGIHRVARKPAAEMIVHAARRHLAQGEQIHLERVLSLRSSPDCAHTRGRENSASPAAEISARRRSRLHAHHSCARSADRRFQRRAPNVIAARRRAAGRLLQRPDDPRPLFGDFRCVLCQATAIRSSTFLNPGCP